MIIYDYMNILSMLLNMVYYGDNLNKWNRKLFLQTDFAAARNGLPMDAMAVIDHVLLKLGMVPPIYSHIG